MTHKTTSDQQEAALRAEANALTPTFDPRLHDKIMRHVRKHAEARKSGAVLPFVAPTNRYRPVWRSGLWLSGIAAALIIGIALWSQKKTAVEKPVADVPSIKPVESLLNVPTQTAREQMEARKYGYLDRDARRFAGYVLSQLPGRQE